MMWFGEPKYDPVKSREKAKLKKKWLDYLTPIWNGGDVKMNRKINAMVAKGKTPPINIPA